ncbi:MAG: hypothetical protein EBR82_74585 [Caulobacteraceae bacterium]|nr:hypothetical protein [Caulobacteraceae bacterium]
MMHDSAKRFGRIVGDGQGTDFAHGKGRDASHKRSRRKTMEAGKSKKSIETHSELVTIHRLLRDIRELGCRVTKIANATWEIAQGEEGGASCILVGDESLQRKLASSHWGEAKKRVSEAEIEHAQYEELTRATMKTSEVQEVYTKFLGQIRSLLDALPASLATRANPSDPECAKTAIQEGIDQIFIAIQKAQEGFK